VHKPILRVFAAMALTMMAYPGITIPKSRNLTSRTLATAPKEVLLDEIQRRAFLFFWNETDPVTGLVKDRAGNFRVDDYRIASIASTGFGLSALPIGVERGWVSRKDAQARALKTGRTFETVLEHRNGVMPHFVEFGTGKRAWKCEFSTIDTALAIAGMLTAGEYFGGEVKKSAERLANRIDWVYWSPRKFINHGSIPEEREFIWNDYGHYSEALLMYVLAIGSPSRPIPAGRWHELGREYARYGPYSCIAGPSLFMNQYPNHWLDFRNRHDGVADYFENLKATTLANRLYGKNQAGRYSGFGPDIWGHTAGDGPKGYNAWAAEPGGAVNDGTISPHAPGGSFQATPVESERALRAMLKSFGARIWGRYGFTDTFNPTVNWFGPDVIGIDTGATLLAIENHRTGLIHKLMMKNATVQAGMKRIGFKPVPPATGNALQVLPLIQSPANSEFRVIKATFTPVPSNRAKWEASELYVYGGVATTNVRITLNGKPLGAGFGTPRWPSTPAFRIPKGLLKYGKPNRLEVRISRAAEGTVGYGPVLVGTRNALEFKPLAFGLGE
jgi:hypothetical protein